MNTIQEPKTSKNEAVGGVVIDNMTLEHRCPSYNKKYAPSYFHTLEEIKVDLKIRKVALEKNCLYAIQMEFGNYGNHSDSDNQSKSFLDALKEQGCDDRNFIMTTATLRKVAKKEQEYIRFTVYQFPTCTTMNDITYSLIIEPKTKYKTKNKLKLKIKN